MSEYGIDTDKLHIEITETALSEDKQAAHKTIERSHNEGFIIEIDDLEADILLISLKMCADVIKIDRYALRRPRGAWRADIKIDYKSFKHDIGMDVITEGVEMLTSFYACQDEL